MGSNWNRFDKIISIKETRVEILNPEYAIIAWFIFRSLVFFFLSFNAGSWAGNPFLNNFFSGLMECAACLLSVAVINKCERRSIIIFCLSSSGALVLLIEILQAVVQPSAAVDILGVVLLLVAKFTISASFNLLFLYTSEIFPTTVRNTALGLSSTGGRMASIISPFLIQLQKETGRLIPVVLGLLLLCSAAMAIWCPETNQSAMLSTVEEAESFYRTQRRFSLRNKSIPEENNNRVDFVPPASDEEDCVFDAESSI